jgi:hypothetical protein
MKAMGIFTEKKKIEKANNQKQKTKQNVIFQLSQFSIFFCKNNTWVNSHTLSFQLSLT